MVLKGGDMECRTFFRMAQAISFAIDGTVTKHPGHRGQ